MNEFTSTRLKRNSTDIFDAVEKDGWVRITHRDRQPMLIMTEEQLRKAFKEVEQIVIHNLNQENNEQSTD